MKRTLTFLPWWAWIVVALAVIGAADERWLAPAGLVGAAAVLFLLVRVILRRRRPMLDDWRDAERLTASWLRNAGCAGVTLTATGADGGIDVLTRDWAVQVKHRSARTGRPAVQQIVGAALDVDRHPAIVSTSGFTAPAIAYADTHDVALVELDAAGRGTRVNAAARQIGRRRRARFRR